MAWVGDLGPTWNGVTERTSLRPLRGAECLSIGQLSHPVSRHQVQEGKQPLISHIKNKTVCRNLGPRSRSPFSPSGDWICGVVILNKTPGPLLCTSLPHPTPSIHTLRASLLLCLLGCSISFQDSGGLRRNLGDLGTFPGAARHLLRDMALGSRWKEELLSCALE